MDRINGMVCRGWAEIVLLASEREETDLIHHSPTSGSHLRG